MGTSMPHGEIRERSMRSGYRKIGRSGDRVLCLGRLLMVVSLLALVSSVQALAQAPEGIPRELARQRAQQLKDVRYRLRYDITAKAASVTGHEELRFVENGDARGILPEWVRFPRAG